MSLKKLFGGSIKSSVFPLLKTSVFAGGLNLVSLLYFIANTSKESYGLFVTLLSFFSIFQQFISGYDESLLRFLPGEVEKKRYTLIGNIILIKFVLAVSVIICLLFVGTEIYKILKITNIEYDTFYYLFLILNVKLMVLVFHGTFEKTILSFKLYNSFLIINGCVASINLMGTYIVVQIFNCQIIYYAILNLITITISMVFGFLCIQHHNNRILFKIINQMNFTNFYLDYSNFIKKYSVPLNIVSLFSLAKNHGLNLILARFAGVELVGILSVIRVSFDFLHNFFSNTLNKLYPVIFNKIEKINDLKLTKFYIKLYIIIISIRLLIIGCLFCLGKFILNMLGIHDNNLALYMFYIYGIEFFCQHFLTYLNLCIAAGKSTHGIMLGSIVRSMVGSILMIGMYALYDVRGLMISFPIATLISIPIMWRHVNGAVPVILLKQSYYLTVLIASASMIIISNYIY